MEKSVLSMDVIELMKQVFRQQQEIEKVVLFGSRAKGTAKENSDIDLAIFGIEDALSIEAIAQELEELPLPYKFDVKSFETIRNLELREHINRVGITVYNKGV